MRFCFVLSLSFAVVGSAPAAASTVVLSSAFATHDTDSDSVPDLTDNAPNISNVAQTDSDADGAGDVRDQVIGNPDADADGFGQEYDLDDSDSFYWTIEGVVGGSQTVVLGDPASIALSLEVGPTLPRSNLASVAVPVVDNYVRLGLWVDDPTASGSPDAWWIGTAFETTIDLSALQLAALGFTLGVHDLTTEVDFLGFGGLTHTAQIEVIPEPSTIILTAFGLLSLGISARRRRSVEVTATPGQRALRPRP